MDLWVSQQSWTKGQDVILKGVITTPETVGLDGRNENMKIRILNIATHTSRQAETITSINEDTTPEVHDSATVYDTHSKFKPPDNQPQWTKTTLIKHIKQQAFLRTNHVDSMSSMTTWSHVSMPDELHHRENDNEQEN